MRTRIGLVVAWTAMGLFATAAMGDMGFYYTEGYEMTYSPETVAGTVYGHTLTAGDGGSGFTFADGIATFLDSSATPGNLGLYNTGTWMNGSTNFVLDMRLRVLQNTQPAFPAASKSFSFRSGFGRGLHVDTDAVSFVNGSGAVGTASGNDFSVWGIYRVIIDGSSNLASFYRLDNYAPWGFETATLLAQTNMGGSGWGGEIPNIGFGLGSLAGSSTTLSSFQLDWVRVYSGTIPEPATLSLLALGAAPLLRRRR